MQAKKIANSPYKMAFLIIRPFFTMREPSHGKNDHVTVLYAYSIQQMILYRYATKILLLAQFLGVKKGTETQILGWGQADSIVYIM